MKITFEGNTARVEYAGESITVESILKEDMVTPDEAMLCIKKAIRQLNLQM